MTPHQAMETAASLALQIFVCESLRSPSCWQPHRPRIVLPDALLAFPAEERKLATCLGDVYADYADYRRRVPRWWPRPSGLKTALLEGATRSRSFRLELLRTPCWLSLPLLAELLFALRQRW